MEILVLIASTLFLAPLLFLIFYWEEVGESNKIHVSEHNIEPMKKNE